MTIPIPTIDDFDTSTVMTTIREVVDYLMGMVPQINNGDITDLKTTYTNNVLTVTLVKGDGTTISKKVTIQGGSGTESPYPTGVDLSVSGNNLSINIPMSGASALKDTVALPQSGTDFNPDDYDIYFGPSGTDIVAKIVEKDTVQTTEPSLNLSSDNNTMEIQAMVKNSTGAKMIIGTSDAPIINSVSGSVIDGKLRIIVNGVSSGDIPLP